MRTGCSCHSQSKPVLLWRHSFTRAAYQQTYTAQLVSGIVFVERRLAVKRRVSPTVSTLLINQTVCTMACSLRPPKTTLRTRSSFESFPRCAPSRQYAVHHRGAALPQLVAELAAVAPICFTEVGLAPQNCTCQTTLQKVSLVVNLSSAVVTAR